MPTPTPSAPMPPRWRVVLALGAVGFVLLMVALRWDNVTGFTRLIQFDGSLAARRVPALHDVPVATVDGGGYDGQFYAQIAVDTEITSLGLQHALDDPQYRCRRILLPLLAHLGGAGRPFLVLQVYALLNVFCWLVLAKVWRDEVAQGGNRGFYVWLACLLSLGALDSVRLSLTDLPSTLCLVLAARAAMSANKIRSALWFLAAGFVRETSVLAAPMLKFGPETTPPERFRAWATRFACALPVLLWCGWLAWKLPGQTSLRLFDWPMVGPGLHVAKCLEELAAGNFDSRYLFGLIGTLGLAAQSVYLLARWRDGGIWVRLGLPFALLFWILGPYVFSGYWAAARACLPMTFAFNRLLIDERRFWPWFIGGNFFLLHGLWRMLP